MSERSACLLTVMFSAATFMSYFTICLTYPYEYEDDEVWMVICKIWVGLAIIILSFIGWGYLFGMFIRESL